MPVPLLLNKLTEVVAPTVRVLPAATFKELALFVTTYEYRDIEFDMLSAVAEDESEEETTAFSSVLAAPVARLTVPPLSIIEVLAPLVLAATVPPNVAVELKSPILSAVIEEVEACVSGEFSKLIE